MRLEAVSIEATAAEAFTVHIAVALSDTLDILRRCDECPSVHQ